MRCGAVRWTLFVVVDVVVGGWLNFGETFPFPCGACPVQ
jgi:hypothetical protein